MKQSAGKVYGNFEKSVLNYVKPSDNLKILDLGCGNGDMCVELIQNYNAKVYGVTISNSEALIANSKLENCIVHDLNNGLPREIMAMHFDYILMSHVLEHVCYPNKLLSDLNELLELNTEIIVALPNIMHYNSRFKLFMGDFEYTESGIYDYTHFRWYTFKSASKLFKDSGFEVIYSDVTIELPLGRITNILFRKSLKLLLLSILKFLSKGFFGWELVYILKKKSFIK